LIRPSEEAAMPAVPVATKKFYTAAEANRSLPLVRVIVADIVRQWRGVAELESRLSATERPPAKGGKSAKPADLYEEERAQSRAELESQQAQLQVYVDELNKLGVELKGPDGLCDFPGQVEGREVCLCWRLGEPEVGFWHEVDAGFAGRKPIGTLGARGRRSSAQ